MMDDPRRTTSRLDRTETRNLAALVVLAAFVVAASTVHRVLPAQRRSGDGDDLRDLIVLESGRKIRGRLETPFAEEEWVIRRGGKRLRVRPDQVRETRTVREHTAELIRLRLLAGEDTRKHWPLVAWAASRELDAMAHLQATWVALLDPSHVEAHEFLGHRRDGNDRWLWPDPPTPLERGDARRRFLELDALEQAHQGHGQALRLRSEHFSVLSDGRLRSTVATLFDLESLYATFFDEFGPRLRPLESLRPMELQIWSDETEFPITGAVERPYYVPHPFGDYGASRLRSDPLRPDDLWSIGTQMILYRCLAQNAPVGDPLDRLIAWAEIGLGETMQARLDGAPGLAQIGDRRIDPSAGDWTLNGRKYELPNLIHLSLRNHFYGALLTAGEPHFSASHLFVEFLLENGPASRDGFLELVRGALAEGKGDSSSAFDKALGTQIETLEEPFTLWVEKTTGIARTRRR